MLYGIIICAALYALMRITYVAIKDDAHKRTTIMQWVWGN